jgi:hypothetical protein
MAEVSGPQWCPRYPGSADVADLTPDFRDAVRAFISRMEAGGASVRVSATYRPPQRVYLMHWCWMIARGGFPAGNVPMRPDVPIIWVHKNGSGASDLGASHAAAEAMVQGYALKFEPSLTTLHAERRAIDMTIAWNGTLAITDFNATPHSIASEPRNGSNPELVKVGATFGVIKLLSDPPHWSDNGH